MSKFWRERGPGTPGASTSAEYDHLLRAGAGGMRRMHELTGTLAEQEEKEKEKERKQAR